MFKKVIFTVSFLAVVGAAAWSAHIVTSPEAIPPQDFVAQARSLMEQGQKDQAMSMLQNSLKSGAKNQSVHLLLGELFLEKGDLAQAQAHYGEALKLDAKNAKAYIGLGLVDIKQQNINGAIQKFTLAMKADPASADPAYHMGNLALGSGKPDVAMNFYQKALQLDPTHNPTLTVVAQMNELMKKNMGAKGQN